jgi:hypothetical protein
MDFSASVGGFFQKTSVSFWLIGIAVIVLVFFSARLFVNTPLYVAQFNKLTPSLSSSSSPSIEGFQGVVFGSGDPPCLRDLDAAARVLDALSKSNVAVSDATDANLRELALLLSKLACLKKDLMSPSGIVLNTRHLQFETHHDREPVAEVAAQCLGRTIPGRDLDIIFETYKKRGLELIKSLTVEMKLPEEAARGAEGNFQRAWADVYEVAQSRCLATDQNGAGPFNPEPAAAYLPPSLDYLKAYQGYY